MAANHFIVPTLPIGKVIAARLGTGPADKYTDTEVGKAVKLSGESQYVLAVAGDAIEGVITQVESGTSAGYTVGGVATGQGNGYMFATADGLQGTPGTGVIALGDLVVVGTLTAKGTALAAYPKVCKATSQTLVRHAWRVVSLGTAGTGAVGTRLCLEKL